jgi:hypothetical protein
MVNSDEAKRLSTGGLIERHRAKKRFQAFEVDAMIKTVAADTVRGRITEENFEQVFEQLVAKVKAEGIPIERAELYESYTNAFGAGQKTLHNIDTAGENPLGGWGDQVEHFKKEIGKLSLGLKIGAAAIIASLLIGVVGISNHLSAIPEGGRSPSAEKAATAKQVELDKLIETYGADFTPDYITAVFNRFANQRNRNHIYAARATATFLDEKKAEVVIGDDGGVQVN